MIQGDRVVRTQVQGADALIAVFRGEAFGGELEDLAEEHRGL